MQTLKVKKDTKLDLFLKDALGISRKQAKSKIDAGLLKVNGKKVIIASWELEAGDKVDLLQDEKETLNHDEAKNYYLKVVHEDEDLLVVEKDAGLLSEAHPRSLKPALPQIVYEYLKRTHPELSHPFVLPIHRLDQHTSGLMVYGKSKRANALLTEFKTHNIHRRYQALVEGRVSKSQGRIDAPLLKTPQAKGAKMQVSTGPLAQKAITDYRVIHRYPKHTLLEVDLKTGRTHQIRAHLSYLGFPVVGDPLYGKNKNPSSTKAIGLHASELGFRHPASGKKLLFRSKLPKHFRKWVDQKIGQV
ncbi:MAG: RluA family pseudouridine synthase [Deltaproteobacteria bacterium]|nr:RluA family pseudouridine synthase [Deltaproteobacteria bacterium]